MSSEDADSIEIAANCISEAFKVDATDNAAMTDALGGQNLFQIYSVYEKLKGKTAGAGASASTSAPKAGASAPSGGVSAEAKEKADKLKAQGNAAMQQKDYQGAIDYYTQALDLNPLNPIYLSNRAAAYSGSGRHAEAQGDAEMATAADPMFAKAWSRLGLAKFAQGDAQGAMEAYQRGIEAEGSGGSEAMRKGFETAKRRVEEEGGDVDDVASRGMPGAGGAGGMPDLSSLAGMFGGGGAGGGAGGMPDIGAMMQNPMMRQMAQNLMSNPEAMQNLLSNPRLRQMAESFMPGAGGAPGGGAGGAGGAGGMDFASMMNDPSIQEM